MIRTLWKLLLVMGGLLISVAGLAALAWTGWLPGKSEQLVKQAADWALDLYNLYRDEVHRVAAVLAAAVSAVFGALTFARAWHYADASLPARLQEFIESARELSFQNRTAILAEARSASNAAPPIWRLSEWRRTRAVRRYLVDIESQAGEIEARLGVLESAHRQCAIDRATAHLAAAERARAIATAGTQPVELAANALREARDHYRAAAKLDGSAIPYLGDAAAISFELDEDHEAERDVDGMIASQLDPSVRARAYIWKATILFKRGTTPGSGELVNARRNADEAAYLLSTITTDAGRLALGEARMLAGEVQKKRERYRAARAAFSDAAAIFGEIGADGRVRDEDAKQRVERLLAGMSGEVDENTDT